MKVRGRMVSRLRAKATYLGRLIPIRSTKDLLGTDPKFCGFAYKSFGVGDWELGYTHICIISPKFGNGFGAIGGK